MATPDTKSSLVVVKSMPWEGGTREYSNRYHVTGPETITLTQFETLADAVVTDEADATSDNATIVRVDWCDASTASSTNPHGIVTQTKSYSTVGLHNATGAVRLPGEVASFIRYSTTQRTSKNHPIYLFNYYHLMYRDSSDPADTLSPAFKTLLEEYGDDWIAGFSDGTNTRIRCGPYGAVAQARHVPTYLTHRDFPR